MSLRELPENYRPCGKIDLVGTRRAALCLHGSAMLIAAAMVLIALRGDHMRAPLWAWALACAGYLVYIALHEWTHALIMYLFSGEKPRFGFEGGCAFAGAAAWFNRGQYALIALAPLLIWGAILWAACARFPAAFWPLYALQIGNVSGSVGDLYCAARMISLPRGAMIQDSGTRMAVHAPAQDGEL